MNQPPTGRLKRIDPETLHDYWLDEARDFTPWLAAPENIELLSDAIGIELEVEAVEKSVGPYRADILCKDTSSGHYVIVENQLGKTDHGHIGQLMTYAAGLDAFTVVWIARSFTEEHRAALDWLNKITAEEFDFFGLEIELWQIGDSSAAPRFNVVSRPNRVLDTVKNVPLDGNDEPTETQRLRLEFWTQFRQFMEDRRSPVRIGKPSTDSWSNVSVGRASFWISAVVGMKQGFAQVTLEMNGPQAKNFFRILHDEFKDEIESRLGELIWRELPDAKVSQIRTRRQWEPSIRTAWPQINEWFATTLERWNEVFRPIVRELRAPIESDSSLEVDEALDDPPEKIPDS